MQRTKLTYERQSEIIDFAEQNGWELADVLGHFHFDFDALVYENSEAKHWNGAQPPSLSDFSRAGNGIPFVSFFTGCGGIDLGFETAGFEHKAAFEFSELFCKTLRKNRPGWMVFGPPAGSGDVSNVEETIESLRQVISPDFSGVFVGGPPCQPFSIAANQRFAKSGDNYKRIGFSHETNGNLLFDYVRIIEYFKPLYFVIENVPGLRDIDGGEQLVCAIGQLRNSGYFVGEPVICNAANYGVPQFRERLFVIGSRSNSPFLFPPASSDPIGSGAVLSRDKGTSSNNETRIHKLASVVRYMKLDYGQRDQLGRVDRLDPCLPAKTVIAGGNIGGGRSHLHPEIPRTLSVRECARLQTFPDDYVFVGPTARQFTQVGNAVPPILAAQIAIAIAESVFRI